MDPITAASTFATIVGLLANYKAETSGAAAESRQNFQDWLHEKRHEQLLALLRENRALAASVTEFLSQDRDTTTKQLSTIELLLIEIASKMEGLSGIVASLGTNATISDQCISILKQINDANASQFLEMPSMGGTSYLIWDGNGGSLEIMDARFLEDDLIHLVEYGFLIPKVNAQGHRMFTITRAAIRLLDNVDR